MPPIFSRPRSGQSFCLPRATRRSPGRSWLDSPVSTHPPIAFACRRLTVSGSRIRPMSTGTGLSTASPIKFGTSGWRGLIADDFTFASVRLAVSAIAGFAKAKKAEPTILVGYDTRFYSEEFSQLAVDILQHHGIRTLLCETFTPTPAVAYEIMRHKLDGAINFTASHNPPQYHGL